MNEDERKELNEVEFAPELTSESLAAEAIWEQIQLDRQEGGLSSREDGTRLRRIDPSFQRDFNNT